MVQLKELDETRARLMADAEQERAAGQGRGRRPAGLRQARGRPAPAGRPAGDQRAAHHAPSARPSRPGPPPTARSRRPAARWPWRRSGWPARPPSTTPAPPPRPSGWSRRPSSGPTAAEAAGPRGDRSRPPSHRQQAQTEAEAPADPRPPRGRADRRLGPHPGRVDHRRRQRRGRARAGRAPGRGGPDDQAPRRDHRPARLAARRGRRLRRRRGRRRATGRRTRAAVSRRAAGRGRRAPRPDRAEATRRGPAGGRRTQATGRRARRTSASPAPRSTSARRSTSASSAASAPWWRSGCGQLIERDRLDADPDRGRAVPRGGPQPGGRVLRAPRAAARPAPSLAGDRRACSSRVALFLVAIVPVITDQVAAITDNAPDWFDQLQHNRQVQDLDDEYDVIDKVQRLRHRTATSPAALFGGVARRRAGACSAALVNTFIVIVLTLYFLSSLPTIKTRALPPGPGLAPRAGHASSATGSSSSVGGYVSGAFVVAMCAGISSLVFLFVVGLGRVRRRAGVRGRAARRDPDDRRHHRRRDRHRDRLRHRPEDRASPA